MSKTEKPDSTPEITADKDGSIKISLKDLAALVATATESATQKSAEVIAKALIDSRKPYVDPKQEQNEEQFRKSTLEVQQRIRKNIKAAQNTCPHEQGCNELSEQSNGRSSFVIHRTDTGLTIGICTNCQKLIRSDRPEDFSFFKRKSGNRASSAGIRNFMDPNGVQKRGAPAESAYDDDVPKAAAVA